MRPCSSRRQPATRRRLRGRKALERYDRKGIVPLLVQGRVAEDKEQTAIEVQSEPGRTEFRVALPLAE